MLTSDQLQAFFKWFVDFLFVKTLFLQETTYNTNFHQFLELRYNEIIPYLYYTSVQIHIPVIILKIFKLTFTAFMLQLSGLAAAFWLNVTCIHLWRCMNSLIPLSGSIYYYFFYANGCALLIATVTHIADSCLPDHHSFKPRIGEEYCGIKGYDSKITL